AEPARTAGCNRSLPYRARTHPSDVSAGHGSVFAVGRGRPAGPLRRRRCRRSRPSVLVRAAVSYGRAELARGPGSVWLFPDPGTPSISPAARAGVGGADRPVVLVGPAGLGAELPGGVPGPVGVAQQLPAEHHRVGLARGHDLLRLP